MSKVLEASKKIRLTIKRLCNECYENTRYELEYSKGLDVIEKALKDKEKKDKALEIIKEYPFIVIVIIVYKWSYYELQIHMPNTQLPTQEEYDLLKEELL